MTAPVFLVDPAALDADPVVVTGAEGRHAATVRRIGVGEAVDLVDGAGTRARCVVTAVGRDTVTCAVRERVHEAEPTPRITVVQALPKGDRGELAVELMTEAGVDVIAVTGDFLSDGRALTFLAPLLMELGQVAPIYAVLGDNDFEDVNHPERLIGELKRSRVRLLRNEADLFIRGDRALLIVGVDDPNTHRADLAKALTEADQLWRRSRFAAASSAQADAPPVVVLAHSPEIVRDHDARAHLYLTGHTHGGQICLPGGIALATNTRGVPRYASGLFNIGNSWLYVNRGVGTARIPARLFCPPEIAVFDLQ